MIRAASAGLAAALFSQLAATSDLPAAQPTAPVHHAADVRLDPESRRLVVSDVIAVSGRREIEFRLASWMKVTRFLVDGRPVPFAAAATAWRTILPDAGRHQVELALEGLVPALSTGRNGAMEQAAALAPDGGYLLGEANWLPSTGDDKMTFRLRVGVPPAYRAVATGGLADEEGTDAMYRATFSADAPAPLPDLFFGPYEVRERKSGAIRIRTYFHPDLNQLAEAYLRDSERYLKRYQEIIGPYPYHDFHVISAPVPVGLGFPNLTYIGRRVLPLPFMRGRSLAHEVLHNWWGNGISVDYPTGNWSEGLTTYMADYALAAERDAEQGHQMRLAWLRDFAALPAGRDVPVTRFTAKHDAAAQVVGYNKVAFIFHLLSRELGTATFTDALRLFWQHHRTRIAGWSDLREAFEAASGRDLGWFFDQWLTRAGAPRLHLTQADIEPTPGRGGHRLRFTVRQDPPVYRLTVPVSVETQAGRRQEQIALTGVETTAHLELNSQPVSLHLDPSHDLFRRLLPGETPPILRDVTLASDAVTVIATTDKAMGEIARQLAQRLLDTPVRLQSDLSAAPLLLIGDTRQVERFLHRHGLPGIPASLAGRGTARVWTAVGRDNHPLLAVAADNADALQALIRPLPHYGSRSYLVFDGSRAIDKGIWPATESPLSRRFN